VHQYRCTIADWCTRNSNICVWFTSSNTGHVFGAATTTPVTGALAAAAAAALQILLLPTFPLTYATGISSMFCIFHE